MRRLLIFTVMLFSLSVNSFAQYPELQHDKQKEKQWRSMETGPWDFDPGWYYYLTHKDYSGAYLHWAWFGTSVRFKESKSNIKRIMPTRTAAEEEQRAKLKKANEEMENIKPLYEEDVANAADRNVDLVYVNFKDAFNDMQDKISEGLIYCLKKSNGKLQYQVDQLERQNSILCESIAYIHKTGAGYELENAKREQAYIEYKKQMEELVSRVTHLIGMAQRYY